MQRCRKNLMLCDMSLLMHSLSYNTLQLSRKRPWTNCSWNWLQAKQRMLSSKSKWLSWVRVLMPPVGCDACLHDHASMRCDMLL